MIKYKFLLILIFVLFSKIILGFHYHDNDIIWRDLMIWDNLKFFSEKEKWGDASRMNGVLLLLLEDLRKEFKPNQYFIIHRGYDDNAAPNSQHLHGNAVDFHIKNIDFYEAETIISDYIYENQITCGLGIYPDWKPSGGFHLDVRGYNSRWGRLGKEYVTYGQALYERKRN